MYIKILNFLKISLVVILAVVIGSLRKWVKGISLMDFRRMVVDEELRLIHLHFTICNFLVQLLVPSVIQNNQR
jgi:hypothetical protein